MKTSIFLIVFLSLALSLHAQQEDIVKMYNQAQMATDMGNLDDAIDLYGKILKINPQFVKGYLDLGNIYVKKGKDVNSLENAILNFNKYLQLNPNAKDAAEVKTSVDKLEYVLKKAYQKSDNRALLLGRWASTDGKHDKYNRSLFILDIREFDGKLRIDIEPSSLAYSADFFTKTVYVDDPNADEYAVSFTNDNNYVPSQAKYALNSQVISNASSQLGSLGGVADMLGQYFNSKSQEKDLQKKTLTGYELKINPIPNDNKELKCAIHAYIKEVTPIKEQIVMDTVFDSGFYKVNNNFQNTSPIAGIYTDGTGVSKNTNPINGTTRITNSVNLSHYPDKEISKLYNQYKQQSTLGGVIMGVGLGGVLFGAFGKPLGFDKNTSTTLMVGGGILTVAGIPFLFTSTHAYNKAIKLYNESLERKRNVSELKVGFTGNGVGLALAF